MRAGVSCLVVGLSSAVVWVRKKYAARFRFDIEGDVSILNSRSVLCVRACGVVGGCIISN